VKLSIHAHLVSSLGMSGCITPLSLMPSCLVNGQFVLPVPANLVGWELLSMVGRTWLLSISNERH
jgi:hypothetical protein